MSRYIIDTDRWGNLFDIKAFSVLGIGDDYKSEEKTVWSRTYNVDELEELNSDYINEHYSELQDEAYQKGFEDGKNSIDNGCEGCKYEDQHGYDEPCNKCLHAHASHYTPMPKQDDRIEVGDEVKWNSVVIVITRFCEDGEFNWCDGISQDGRVFRVLAENVRKTGKHYDIQSILDTMKQ